MAGATARQQSSAAPRQPHRQLDPPHPHRVLRQDGNGFVQANWTRPGHAAENIPCQFLHPRYGLTTSATTSESNGVPDKVPTTSYNGDSLDPIYSLATASTQDPGGLHPTSGTTYETSGARYLRQTATTMPTGARTVTSYYGDTETRANPCVAGSPLVNQAGMAKLTTSPSPATGNPITDEQVYDASGRVDAEATSGDWTCTSYDARDRITQRPITAWVARGAGSPPRPLAVEQGQRPLSLVVTAGQRGDSPQFKAVLAGIRVARMGGGWPRTSPDRVLADKAYGFPRQSGLSAAARDPGDHPGAGRSGRASAPAWPC